MIYCVIGRVQRNQSNVKSFCIFKILFQGSYVACLISMLRQMEEHHYEKYLESFPTKLDLMVRSLVWKSLCFDILHIFAFNATSKCEVCFYQSSCPAAEHLHKTADSTKF